MTGESRGYSAYVRHPARVSLLHLGGGRQALARPHGADPRLALQLAARVLVGDPGGDAHAAAARARGPVGGLDRTLPLFFGAAPL